MGWTVREIRQTRGGFQLRNAAGILCALICALTISSLILSTAALAQGSGPQPAAAPRDEGMPVTPSMQTSQSAPAKSTPSSPAAAASGQSTPGIINTPPSVPVDQIIQQFAAHEAEFKTERDNFTYTQTFTVQTIDDGGHPDGEYTMTSDITFSPDGKRYENVTYAPQPTLERITLSPQDFADLENVQPFVLTSVELPKYIVTYVGRQAVDALGTYIFDVAPKTLEKNQRYFQGRIWVDDRDLEIVKTDGKAVPDIRKGSNENVFPRFETYRENIEGHYWFPTYTRSDDFLHFSTGDVHIRMSVRYTNYKRFRVSIRLLPVPSDK
jgi:hypothetical protein